MSIFLAALLISQTAMPPIGQRGPAAGQPASAATLIPDAEQDPAIAAAAAHPLGSPENPVRVGGPAGERAYLARLRCGDGSSPSVGARVDRGPGAFGSLVASYQLSCAGAAPLSLVMDMYHEEHQEDRAPPGFTIQPR
jgi:hypothetical protein